jgi:hypothetical protein
MVGNLPERKLRAVAVRMLPEGGEGEAERVLRFLQLAHRGDTRV